MTIKIKMPAKSVLNAARYADALHNAHKAASLAQVGMVEDMNAMDCGFAWVVVHDRSFMGWCRKAKEIALLEDIGRNYYGDKHYAAGWCFWKPGSFNGQSIGIHEAGARAFALSLETALGIKCEIGSRFD